MADTPSPVPGVTLGVEEQHRHALRRDRQRAAGAVLPRLAGELVLLAPSDRGAGAAGFRAVAPDMRGYGGTEAPEPIDQYTLLHLVGDMVELVKALGETRP